MNETRAAKAVGIAQSTLNGWKRSKPKLYAAIMRHYQQQQEGKE